MELAAAMGARGFRLTGLLPSATDLGPRFQSQKNWPALTTACNDRRCGGRKHQRRPRAHGSADAERARRVRRAGVDRFSNASAGRQRPRNTRVRSSFAICLRNGSGLSRSRTIDRAAWIQGRSPDRNTRGSAPDAVYGATLIVGATNHSEALDVDRIRPGTVGRRRFGASLLPDREGSPPRDGAARRAFRGGGTADFHDPDGTHGLRAAAGVGHRRQAGGDLGEPRRDSHVLMGCDGFPVLLCAPPATWRPRSATSASRRAASTSPHSRHGLRGLAAQCADLVFEDAMVEDFRARFGESHRLENGGFPSSKSVGQGEGRIEEFAKVGPSR